MQNSMMKKFVKESLIDADVLIYMIAIDEDQTKDQRMAIDRIRVKSLC